MDDLQRRLAEGEAAAYAELYDRIADGLFHYLVTQTGTRDDAADLLQETFLRIHRAGTRLGEVEHLKAYCFRVAHHEMLRWRKKHQARPASAERLYEIAVSVLIAAGLWYVNLRVLPARIATLVGPPPAQRQAERAMRMLAIDDNDPARAPMLAFLRWQFRHSNIPDGPALLPSSAAYLERRPLTLRKPRHVETNLEVHGPRGGDTSDRRRRPAVAVAGTA